MVQTYILREDVSPVDAVHNGKDAGVCGDCPLRRAAGGACYVVPFHDPQQVWKQYQAGAYAQPSRRKALKILRGRAIRCGAYGDPFAVSDLSLWLDLSKTASVFTGYTHFWHKPDALPLRDVVMASVETPEARAQAKALGWRTFRMRTEGAPILKGEAQCPYPAIGLQCIRCGACDGRRRGLRGDITEIAHGITASRFTAAIRKDGGASFNRRITGDNRRTSL